MEVARNELWRAYLEHNGGQERNKLIEHYLPLVRWVAGRIGAPDSCPLDFEDLVGYGIWGLIQAIERYDPERGVKFETFAVRRLRGAMLDALRKENWIPRSVEEKCRQLAQAYRQVETRNQGRASEQDVAVELGIDVAELRERLSRYHYVSLVSWEFKGPGGGQDVLELAEMVADPQAVDPSEAVEEGELHQALVQALAGLPEKDRLVLALYFKEGLTLKEIGQVLEVSESRVCQLRARAILRLREMLAAWRD